MNLFVDCGACRGIISNHWLENNNDYWADLFEPRKDIIIPEMQNATIIRKAVWTENKEMKLYFDKRNRIASSSLFGDKKRMSKIFVMVQAIDFAEYIKRKSSEYDKIIIKMDIEGAEYNVIEHLIKTDTIKYINTMYVEWHWRNVRMGLNSKDRKEKHKKLINKLKRIKSLNLYGEYYRIYKLRSAI